MRKAADEMLQSNFGSFIERTLGSVDPSAKFLSNWHIDAIAEYLEATRKSEITRLIINMPPRALKSVCVSVAWPAWLMGHDPAIKIMAASYAQGLSLKHSMDTKLIVNSRWYERAFPNVELVMGENEKHKFVTNQRGFRFATSVGGTATGEGGDVLIIDDPLNPLQAASKKERDYANIWFDQTFSTRLNDKAKGRIVVVMQRLHAEDLSGHLLAKNCWEHLCLPAIAESKTIIEIGQFKYIRETGDLLHSNRENESLIARAKNDLGSFGFAAQYQQSPMIEKGGMIENEWFSRYDYFDFTKNAENIVQSWDTAIKAGAANDASVCVTFAENEGSHYLIDVLSIKAEYPELKRNILRLAEHYQPTAILIEDKASGQSLLQDLRRETNLPLIARMPRGDKVTRLATVSPLIESGKILLPKYSPWLAEFEEELFAFPNAPHDDQVDAFSQYLGWIREKSGGGGFSMRYL